MAVDQESGEAASATVLMEVMAEGQQSKDSLSCSVSMASSICGLKQTSCISLCPLQSHIVHWQRSGWSAALWEKPCFSVWSSWLCLDAWFLWWCGWRRNTRERGTHWKEAAWPKANTRMWCDTNLYYLHFIVFRIYFADTEIFSPTYTPTELTMVSTGEFLINTEANTHPGPALPVP